MTLDALYLYSFVAAVGAAVAILAICAYHFAKKEKVAQRRMKKLIQTYVKERAKQQKRIHDQLARLNELRKKNKIDENTYEYMKNVLLMDEKKRVAANDLVAYVTNKKSETS